MIVVKNRWQFERMGIQIAFMRQMFREPVKPRNIPPFAAPGG
jgi:hypothetical protein